MDAEQTLHPLLPCSVCGQDDPWHRRNNPMHPYSPPGFEWDMRTRHIPDRPARDDSAPSDASSVRLMHGPMDPVLRQALVDKGIITADDLMAAENKINGYRVMFGLQPTGDPDAPG